MTHQDNLLKSVGRTFGIIEHLHSTGGATVTEIATDLSMAKSTVHLHLNTLHEERVVVKRNGQYELGLAFLEYGMGSLRKKMLFPVVKPKIEELAEKTGELAASFVEEHGEAVYIYGIEGEQSIRTDLSVGDRTDLHSIAAGKAILAHLPKSRIQEIIDQNGLSRRTEHTITDPETLFSELAEVRERGYAYSLEESITGMHAVAAPIIVEGKVLGAIGQSGPAHRFTGERLEKRIPELVTGTANEIELKLRYSESGF